LDDRVVLGHKLEVDCVVRLNTSYVVGVERELVVGSNLYVEDGSLDRGSSRDDGSGSGETHFCKVVVVKWREFDI